MAERSFILQFKMAPGDVSMLTSLVRDIKLTYGDRYAVDVRTNFDAIWRHNPYLTKMEDKQDGVEWIKMTYKAGLKRASREKIHFVTEFHRFFFEQTRIKVPCLYPHADLHLSDEEKAHPRISGRYWIVIAGGKTDVTVKWFSFDRLQAVINRLRKWGLRFVQEGAVKKLCVHPLLDNVHSVVGMTSVRDLIVNIQHADGVICPITFQMHIAGALQKPCVVLAGGREEPHWEEYSNDWDAFGDECEKVKVPHRYLHTMGQLECCKTKGCWTQRVIKLNDNTKHDKNLCHLPVLAEGGQTVPKCLDLIDSDIVIEAVMSYYEDGTLAPPQLNKSQSLSWYEHGPDRKTKRHVSKSS